MIFSRITTSCILSHRGSHEYFFSIKLLKKVVGDHDDDQVFNVDSAALVRFFDEPMRS